MGFGILGSMRPSGQLIRSVCVAAFFFASLNICKANHPFHVSTAEVEFNAKTKRLEVGLKCQTTDLERALRQMAGRKVDVESDPQIDELITRYVSENFYLAIAAAPKKADTSNVEVSAAASNDSKTSDLKLAESASEVPEPPKEPVKFIGKEFETKWIWIYFELQPPAGEEQLVLVNRVLFEINIGQLNTCIIRHAGKRHALKSTAAKPLQEFDRKWLISAA